MQEEIWKDVIGYEGIYQVSNLGNIKSLPRVSWNGYGFIETKGRILKQNPNRGGYLGVNLSFNNKSKTFSVHQLVAMAFLGHIPNGYKKVVDHINNDKTDNRVENLQLITQRENTSKDVKNKTSKYTGVYWDKKCNRWRSRITIYGKKISLGYFINEEDAKLAYKNKLKEKI